MNEEHCFAHSSQKDRSNFGGVLPFRHSADRSADVC